MQVSSYLPEHNTQQEAADRNVSTTTRIWRLVLIALGVSLLLQTVAISTPAWRIVSTREYSNQWGLFYVSCKNVQEWKRKFCNKNGFFYHDTWCKEIRSCETISYANAFHDASSRSPEFERYYILEYVHRQVGVMVAWFCALISIIVLTKKYRKREPVPMTLSILASTMAVAGVIMGEVIFVYLVNIGADIRMAGLEDRMSVGFPYSLVLYILACTAVLVSVAALFKCLYNDITTLGQARGDTSPDGNAISMQ